MRVGRGDREVPAPSVAQPCSSWNRARCSAQASSRRAARAASPSPACSAASRRALASVACCAAAAASTSSARTASSTTTVAVELDACAKPSSVAHAAPRAVLELDRGAAQPEVRHDRRPAREDAEAARVARHLHLPHLALEHEPVGRDDLRREQRVGRCHLRPPPRSSSSPARRPTPRGPRRSSRGT